MGKYKFLKGYDNYKKGHILKVEKPNKLVLELIKRKIVELVK